MALNSFAPEYFLQELTPLEMFEFPWVALAGALSLAGPGNKLSWADLEGSVVSASYNNNADVAYSAMSDVVYSITVADYRATAFYVTDIERAQRYANAVASGMNQSMREQMVNLTSVIRTAYHGGRLAVSGLAAPIRGDDDGLGGNVTALTMKDGADTTSTVGWNDPGGRLILLGGVRGARSFGRRHGWPSRFACIAPLEVTEQINALITEDKVNSRKRIDCGLRFRYRPSAHDLRLRVSRGHARSPYLRQRAIGRDSRATHGLHLSGPIGQVHHPAYQCRVHPGQRQI